MTAKKTATPDPVEEVVHTVRRPGGLVAEYIRGADNVVRRQVRKLTPAELEEQGA